MTEKIEWYKEVLELEPNSKVFFPLSRLLAEDGEIDEALSILEDGLERHPEYLEARLYFIELLHKNGMNEKCEAQVDKLSKMFASYAGFWQAWAACLSSEKEADTASILRFLAAQFVAGPIQLHDVLNRGLQTFIDEARPALQKTNAPDMMEAAAAATVSASEESVEAEPQPLMADEAALPDLPENPPAVEEPVSVAESVAEPEIGQATVSAASEAPAIGIPEDISAELDAENEALSAEPALPPDNSPTEELPETLADASFELAGEEPARAVENMPETAPELELEEENPAEAALPPELSSDVELSNAVDAMMDEVAGEMLPDMDAVPEPAAAAPAHDLAAEGEFPAEEPLAMESIAEAGQTEKPAQPLENEDMAVEETPVVMETASVAKSSEEPAAAPIANAGEKSIQSVESAIGELELPEMDELMESALPEPDLAEEALEAPSVEAEAAPAENMPAPDQTPAQNVAVPEEDIETIEVADVAETSEPFSLRTRSMAEVLAEQGDIQGAIDIYRELAATASSGDEAEDINRRITTLEGRLGLGKAREEFAEKEHSSPSRDKLIGMLEALASRVEARAHT